MLRWGSAAGRGSLRALRTRGSGWPRLPPSEMFPPVARGLAVERGRGEEECGLVHDAGIAGDVTGVRLSPLPAVLRSKVSLSRGRPRSKRIKQRIPETSHA